MVICHFKTSTSCFPCSACGTAFGSPLTSGSHTSFIGMGIWIFRSTNQWGVEVDEVVCEVLFFSSPAHTPHTYIGHSAVSWNSYAARKSTHLRTFSYTETSENIPMLATVQRKVNWRKFLPIWRGLIAMDTMSKHWRPGKGHSGNV